MSDLATLRDHRNDHGRLIHPDDGQVYACPCCDAAAPRLRERLKNASVGGDARLCCPDCKTGFDADAVVVRERRHGGGSGLSGTPAVLARTDADAVLPDGGQVDCCPNCQSTKIRTQNGGYGGKPARGDYLCRGCHRPFDVPDQREPPAGGGSKAEGERELAAMDPGEHVETDPRGDSA
jgi:transposase-like protein